MMKKGIGVLKGYVVGKAYILDTHGSLHFNEAAESLAVETEKLKKALELSKKQIEDIVGKTCEKLGEKNVEIIKSHLNYLQDPAFVGEAFSKIKRESISAEKAISDVTQELYQTFAEFDDDYMKERAADIKDVGSRILHNLSGQSEEIDFQHLQAGTVVFAHDLKPSETAQIDKEKVCAFVTEAGGITSHTAILAKALGIPAVVGCKEVLSDVKNGDTVIVDGSLGEVLIGPDAETIKRYQLLAEKYAEKKRSFSHMNGKKLQLKTGKPIMVAANIGGLKDLDTALKNDAEGVGLFRTEFLYMDRDSLPTEEEQFQVYQKAANRLDGKPLTIRTLDIGGDKFLPYLPLESESNPFLGLRAIRLCLKKTDLFQTQLRAILRASAYGNIEIMFPMIGSMEELHQAKDILANCKLQMKKQRIPFNDSIRVGMMIEIPSAALMAEEFAKHVDFFSIGTNDLTQYTLAVDRMNENISYLYNSFHPAVLNLIQMTITAAHNNDIPCGMCGELASDERAIPLLLQYGLDEFSVSPGLVAETKYILFENIQ